MHGPVDVGPRVDVIVWPGRESKVEFYIVYAPILYRIGLALRFSALRARRGTRPHLRRGIPAVT